MLAMCMKSCTYIIENTLALIPTAYVGKANNPYERFAEHLAEIADPRVRFKRSHLANALRKYGRDAFALHVVEECDTEERAFLLEKEWISYLRIMGVKLYNKSSGGYGGQTRSTPESTRLKMSVSHRKRMQSSDLRKKISEKLKGRVKNDATKAKLSKAKQKAVVQLDHLGQPIAIFPSALMAQEATGALRAKICECCKGRRNKAGGFSWRYEQEGT